MMSNFLVRITGSASVCTMVLLLGCASPGQVVSDTPPPVEDEISKTVQAVEPTLPLATETQAAEASTPEPASVAETAPPQKKEIEAGSFASVVKKMEDNPLTLYFRDDQSYRFYLGGTAELKYKPGDGLQVREDKDDALTCHFAEDGSLQLSDELSADKIGKQKKACSTLMFALDQELSP